MKHQGCSRSISPPDPGPTAFGGCTLAFPPSADVGHFHPVTPEATPEPLQRKRDPEKQMSVSAVFRSVSPLLSETVPIAQR
jgi:hypothetical protein